MNFEEWKKTVSKPQKEEHQPANDKSVYKSGGKGYNRGVGELFKYEGVLGEPFTHSDYDEIAKSFVDSGGRIIQSKEVDDRLEKRNAIGSNLGEIILLHSKADRATLAEEVEHGYQRRAGKDSDPIHGDDLLELEAKKAILDKFSFPKEQAWQLYEDVKKYQERVDKRNENTNH